MLYHPASPTTPARPQRTRLWTALRTILGTVFGALAARSSDRRYFDGMRPEELEDLGLRRTESRDYTTFR